MSSSVQPLALELVMPWHPDAEQEKAFKKILKEILVLVLLYMLLFSVLPIIQPEYLKPEEEVIKLEIVLEPEIEEPEPPPPPKVKAKKVEKKPVPVPKAEVAKKPKTEPKKSKAIAKKSSKPAKKPTVSPPKKAKRNSDLSSLSAQLSALKPTVNLSKLQTKNVSTNQGGKASRRVKTVLGQEALSKKSQGIVVDEATMSTKGIALAAHSSTKLDGFIPDGGSTDTTTQFNSYVEGRRSDESIRKVFESGKSRAYTHYLKALKKQPDLSGTLVFEVTIAPSGKISQLTLVSSELGQPALEAKILNSIKALRFGAQAVSPRKLTYRFNFLPS